MTKRTVDWNMKHKIAKAKTSGTTSKYDGPHRVQGFLKTTQPELDAKGKKRLAEILAQYPMKIE